MAVIKKRIDEQLRFNYSSETEADQKYTSDPLHSFRVILPRTMKRGQKRIKSGTRMRLNVDRGRGRD